MGYLTTFCFSEIDGGFGLEKLKEIVFDCWDEWDLGAKPDAVSVIRRSSTWLGEKGKVVYLFFRKGAYEPSVVAKTVHSREFGAVIQKEAENSRKVWDMPGLRHTVPRPLGVEKINGIPVYFEEACPGVAFPEQVRDCWRRKNKEKLIRETVDALASWLFSFQGAFGLHPTILGASEVEEHFLAPLKAFAERSGPLDKNERKFLQECLEIAEALAGRSVALPPAHGDLWGGSVLKTLNGGMRIIDWEFFKPHGLPLEDLIYFSIHPGFAIRGKEDDGLLAEFKNLFYENVLVSTMREYLKSHAKSSGLEDSGAIKMLIGVVLAKLSLERDWENVSVGSGAAWSDLWRYMPRNNEKCALVAESY